MSMKIKLQKIRDRVPPSLRLNYLKSLGCTPYCVPANRQSWLKLIAAIMKK